MDQIWILITPDIRKTFTKNSSSLIVHVEVPQTVHIHGGCHKDIKDGKDMFMDEKDDL